MFLKYIKNFGLKKIVKKSLTGYKPAALPGVITTVGIILDESNFKQKEHLVKTLVKHGVKEGDIETLSFKESLGSKELPDCCYYTRSHIAANGGFTKEDAAAFINKPFDLLISYYDFEKPALAIATIQSRAKFKAGFATADNRLNALVIQSVTERYEEFTAELFKYLKNLNKI